MIYFSSWNTFVSVSLVFVSIIAVLSNPFATRHSPHVSNGSLNVANGFNSEYFKSRKIQTKIDTVILGQNRGGPGYVTSIGFVVFLRYYTLLSMFSY